MFDDINEDDIKKIGGKWIYLNEDKKKVIKYKWVWEKAGVKGEKYSWSEEEKEWLHGGMGGWDSKIASCIPTPLKINPFDDSAQLEKQIVEILISAVKENLKKDNSKLSDMMVALNEMANEVKKEISVELSKTTDTLQTNIGNIFPNYRVDLEPQAGKIDVDKILAAGTHLKIADSCGQLHQPAIRAAREALYKIADLPSWQVMITTHSPIFIDI